MWLVEESLNDVVLQQNSHVASNNIGRISEDAINNDGWHQIDFQNGRVKILRRSISYA